MRHFMNSATGLQCCGGNCSRNADEHEDRVEKLQNKEEKRVDEIASADEIKLKRIEEIKKSLRGLSAEELDDELEKLRAELEDLKENLKKDKAEAKINREFLGANNNEATGTYSVLMYNDQSITHEGDSLLQLMGSSQ